LFSLEGVRLRRLITGKNEPRIVHNQVLDIAASCNPLRGEVGITDINPPRANVERDTCLGLISRCREIRQGAETVIWVAELARWLEMASDLGSG
jgi:hypothetical protein